MMEDDVRSETAIAPISGYGKEITPSMTDSLKAQRQKTADKLANLDETIKLIESQPEIQKVLDALSRLGKLRNL